MYNKFKGKEKGQGLVEYALILVLVAIVVIAVLVILGPVIGNVFSKVNSSLAGLDGVGNLPYAASCTNNNQCESGVCNFDSTGAGYCGTH